MELICIDLEASGLGPDSYPVEVAWKSAESGAQDSFLINPESAEGWVFWDEFAEEMHGIEWSTLTKSGIGVRAACERLNTALFGKDVVCDALEFDAFWLRRLFRAGCQPMNFTLKGIESVLSPEQRIQYRLVSRSQYRRHRALDDVEDQLNLITWLIEEEAGA